MGVLSLKDYSKAKQKIMCVSGYMEFQNTENRDGGWDFFFLFCSKFLHGYNRETVCQNGKIH